MVRAVAPPPRHRPTTGRLAAGDTVVVLAQELEAVGW